jgi:hypothetical protein
VDANKIARRGLFLAFILLFIGFMLNVCDYRASKDQDRWRHETGKNFQKDFHK